MALDPLSDLLRLARVEAALFSRARAGVPWGVSTRGGTGGIFHVVLRGEGVARALDGHGAPVAAVAFGPGDVLVFPHGHAHVLADAPDTPPTWIRALVAEPGDDGLACVRAGADTVDAELLCGTLRFSDEARELLLPQLPPLLHAVARGPVAGWLDATVRHLADEVARGAPGAEVVVARLGEVLFVEALRAWAARAPAPGVLHALADPPLAKALSLLHAAPAREWPVDVLARKAGLSRTAFYDRFTHAVGEPPAAYLLRWRMTLARRALLDPRASVAEVADRVGYGSEAAFARAFKRAVGTPPAAWRRARAAGGDAREAGGA